MNSSLRFTFIISLCFLTFTCASRNIEKNINSPISMFKNWVYGIKNKDFEKFKDGYTQDDWDKMTKNEQKELLNSYSLAFNSVFGKYKIKDFEISYQGNEQKGKLIIFHKGKKAPSLKVKKVKNDWVLAEK